MPLAERVAQHREEIRELVAAHHATRPRLFGSTAQGEDRAGSDVDLLVDFTDEATLLDEVGLRQALIDLLRVEVDVIAVDALRGSIRERALHEAVPATDPEAKARDAAERVIAMCDVLTDMTRMDVIAFVDDVRTQ